MATKIDVDLFDSLDAEVSRCELMCDDLERLNDEQYASRLARLAATTSKLFSEVDTAAERMEAMQTRLVAIGEKITTETERRK